ncbi:hypothetical protein GCM10027060_04140 [Nesterenkonia halophila]
MSAEDAAHPEQRSTGDAEATPTAGEEQPDDLRARYLPVSRRELRRRREVERKSRRERRGSGAAQATAPEAAETSGEDSAEEAAAVDRSAEAEDETSGSAEARPETDADDTAPEAPAASDEAADAEGSAGSTADAESAESAEEAATDSEEMSEDASGEADDDTDDETDDADRVAAGDTAPETPSDDDELPPVPASRKGRLLLRETGQVPALDTQRRAEIDALTAEIVSQAPSDPHAVDPELLKKQQEMAAKAMQANQERRRLELADQEAEHERRRDERPESEVITRKTLRGYADAENPDPTDVAAGEIEPVEASGAHGLELDEMVEQTSRRASRQSAMLWLVIALSVLLLIAVGVVLYTILS